MSANVDRAGSKLMNTLVVDQTGILNRNFSVRFTLTTLYNLLLIPNSVRIGFGPAMKTAHQDDSNNTPPQPIYEFQAVFP